MSLASRMSRGPALDRKSFDPFDYPWSSGPPPEEWLRGAVASSPSSAMGVPALLGVISLIAGAVAQCSMLVFSGDGDDRKRATGTWQWDLLHSRPAPAPSSPSQVRADLAASLAGSGQFALRKYPLRQKVSQLRVLDPRKVKPKWKNGAVVYEDSTEGDMVERTSREIIFGRLFSPTGGLCGTSPITHLRRSTQAALARDEYQSRVMQNNAAPGLIYKSRAQLTQDQANAWADNYMAQHAGPPNAGKPTIIGSQDDMEVIPVSLRDLQFVEQNQVTREVIAGAYHLPTVYLGDGARPPVYEDRFNLTTFCLGPILTAIDDALTADATLFPPGKPMFVEMLPDALLRMSTRERYASYKDARQAGVMTSNEIRGIENLPPHEDGDILQTTPVGGAVPESAITPVTDPTLPPD